MKKHIRFVHDHFRDVGGVERHIVNLSNELVSQGHTVEVVSFERYKDPIFTGQFDKRVKLISFYTPRLFGVIPLFFHYLFSKRPDAVFSSKTYVDIMAILAHRLSFSKARLICTIVTMLTFQQKYEVGRLHKGVLVVVYALCRLLYPFVDHFAVISKEGVDDLKTFLSRSKMPPISVIYNAITSDVFLKDTYPKPDHRWFNEDTPIILGVGRLCVAKNFKLLIDAFALVRKETEVRLLILGEGGLRKPLQQHIKALKLEKEIDLPGVVSNPQDYMHHARLFVLSSEYEGFGNVLIEAIATGTQVISTDRTPAPKDVDSFEKYHRLVTTQNPEDMAQAIFSVLEQEKPVAHLIQAQAKKFSATASARQYLALAG